MTSKRNAWEIFASSAATLIQEIEKNDQEKVDAVVGEFKNTRWWRCFFERPNTAERVTPPRIFFDFLLVLFRFLDERRTREYFLGITSFTSH